MLLTFYLRNVFLFVYEVYGISIKLQRVSEEKQVFLDFVLQVMNAAFRGSAARFFFTTIFKDIKLGPVCIDEQRNEAMLPNLTVIEVSSKFTYIEEYDYTLKRM